MQPEDCLNEAQIIGGQIANDGWKPNLVLNFEKMEPGQDHETIAFTFTLTV